MKILRVSKQPLSPLEKNSLEQYGIMTVHSSPTLLSAITAMRIAKAADRHDIDIVTVSRQSDAVAALSARKIARNKKFGIIYSPEPNTDCPHNLHRDVAEGIDGWIFVSPRQKASYPDNLKNTVVIPPAASATIDAPMPDLSVRPLTMAWIGDITNSERLREVIDIIDEADTEVMLRISGAGKARDVMPAVKHSRAMTHPERLVWVGEEYNLTHEVSAAAAAIRTNLDLTDIERQILQTGRMVIEATEIQSFIKDPTMQDLGHVAHIDRYAEGLRQYCLTIINAVR